MNLSISVFTMCYGSEYFCIYHVLCIGVFLYLPCVMNLSIYLFTMCYGSEYFCIYHVL